MMSVHPSIQTIGDEIWLVEDERNNLKIHYRLKEIIYAEQSPCQHVMIVDSYDFGRMLVLDGIVQTTSLDGAIYNEMISHVPLSTHPDPKKVLIIGGGDCGVAKEVLKYPNVQHVDMVEIDEKVVELCCKYLPEVAGNAAEDSRLHIHFADGVRFVEEATNQYDVVIVDSSDPIGPAVELFSEAFYQNVSRILKEDGLMVCQSQSPLFHAEVTKQTFDRISRLFPHTKLYMATVPTYPGGVWSFTLGSKKYQEANKLPANISTFYVNHKLLKDSFTLPTFVQERILD